MLKKKTAWLSLLLVFGLVAAACSDDETGSGSDTTEEGATDDTAAPGDCPDVDGDVNVSGSSTVEPISAAVGEKLLDCGSGVAATVDGPGTGDGFVLFCDGETDISDASRAIKAEEAEVCADNGIEFVELKIAIDGLSVLTNPANDAVECLSFADIYALVGAESQDFGNWSDAAEIAAALGSSTEFPDAALDITAPGAESGTFDSFAELALADAGEARVESGDITEDDVEVIRPDYASQADDTAIIAGIEGSETSFGWVGFAFAEEAGDGIKELAVSAEPDGECVEPTAETIASGEYPLSRPLFIYVNVASATDNEAVAAYVDYYLSEAGIASVAEVGYVDLEADVLEATRAVWEAKETGTREG